MATRRIHLTGPSGAGVTTTGRALADRLALPHHDTDDFFWLPTETPYREKRPAADRLRLMVELFVGRSAWVLSGSLIDWGDPMIQYFDLVVLVTAPTEIRITRLQDREARRFGEVAVSPGGWRHAELADFLEWASQYDDPSSGGRTRARHEAWLARLPCPVLRTDGTRPPHALVDEILTIVPQP